MIVLRLPTQTLHSIHPCPLSAALSAPRLRLLPQGVITIDLNAYRDPAIVNGAHGFAYLPNMKGGSATLAKQERDGGYLRLQVNDRGKPTPGRRASAQWVEMLDEQGTRHILSLSSRSLASLCPPLTTPMHSLHPAPLHPPSTTPRKSNPTTSGRDWSFELARINEANSGKRHRFAFGFTGFNHQHEGANRFGPGGAVVKMDAEANPAAWWVAPPSVKPAVNRPPTQAAAASAAEGDTKPAVSVWSSATVFPSEPVFVARPGATREDDGVLLFLGYDTLRRESFMGVLEASDMSEAARVYCGTRCPVSFHGHWIPA